MNVSKLKEDLRVDVKTYMSNESLMKFRMDIIKLENKDFAKFRDSNYIIIELFISIGKPDDGIDKVLEYRNKNEIYLALQPKIKNYILFKNKDSRDNYIKNELTESDLYLTYNIKDGHTIVD